MSVLRGLFLIDCKIYVFEIKKKIKRELLILWLMPVLNEAIKVTAKFFFTNIVNINVTYQLC